MGLKPNLEDTKTGGYQGVEKACNTTTTFPSEEPRFHLSNGRVIAKAPESSHLLNWDKQAGFCTNMIPAANSCKGIKFCWYVLGWSKPVVSGENETTMTTSFLATLKVPYQSLTQSPNKQELQWHKFCPTIPTSAHWRGTPRPQGGASSPRDPYIPMQRQATPS